MIFYFNVKNITPFFSILLIILENFKDVRNFWFALKYLFQNLPISQSDYLYYHQSVWLSLLPSVSLIIYNNFPSVSLVISNNFISVSLIISNNFPSVSLIIPNNFPSVNLIISNNFPSVSLIISSHQFDLFRIRFRNTLFIRWFFVN